MKESFLRKWETIENNLFSIGLASLFCSFIFALITRFYANFVFKPQYYHLLTPVEQQQWWFKLIDLQQGSEFFRSPLTQGLLFLTLCMALVGFALMGISVREKKRHEKYK